MFDGDIVIRGKHATYMKFLKDSANVFNRHMDIYLLAPILGMNYSRLADEDKELNENIRMFADVVIREQTNLQFIYRLVTLLDENSGRSIDERIDRAFRYDSDESITKENLTAFNRYALGGIEYLYEKFTDNCTTKQDYIDKVYEFVELFKVDIDGINEEKLKELATKGI